MSFLLVALAGTALAADATFTPSVQERARAELVADKNFDGGPDGTLAVGNRARLGLAADWEERVQVFAQLQDVRLWGSEFKGDTGGEGTLFDFSANGLDMHQGYGVVKLGEGTTLKVGRQEVAWNGQRLIGAVGWTHQARSFDAVRLERNAESYGAEVLYSLLLDRPNPLTVDAERGDDVHLLGLKAGPRMESHAADVLVILRADLATGTPDATFGAHSKGKAGTFAYEAEAYGQIGEDAAGDSRFDGLVGLRGGAATDNVTAGAGADVVSATFDTLYATNHKFYGHLDMYLALPVHTQAQGLIDALVYSKFKVADSAHVGLDLHAFLSATEQEYHGFEIDLNSGWRPVKPLGVGLGVWTYVPGDFWPGSDVELGGYFQMDFKLAG